MSAPDIKRAYLKPRAGTIVRVPASRLPLPPEGMAVELTSYWRRRVADGDVEMISAPKRKSGAAKPARSISEQES